MGTVVATPEVRARFIRVEPGTRAGMFHSHEKCDAIEIWVVLEGQVKFKIEDQTVIASPGQAVLAYPHETHRVSSAGAEPAVYQLTATPHRSPTHNTHYDAQGNRLPSRPRVANPTWRREPAMGPHGSSPPGSGAP